MARKINYDNWSKEELIKELRRIKETKYGLVWHRDLPEEKIDILINPDARTPSEMFPNEMAGKPFPILKEAKGKELNSDKDKPVNLLIEGDNYHSLAVLNFTHQEAIDLIYIDPPYNTGNDDFVYNDKIKNNYVKRDDPFRHSKWISFIEKRLKLAKNLLKKQGIIFVSIDDNEQAPLKMLCDEIFDEKNFIANIVVQSNPRGKQQMDIAATHEYLLVYAKNTEELSIKHQRLTNKQIAEYSKEDKIGKYREIGLRKRGAAARRIDVPNLYYPIYVDPKTGNVALTKNSVFSKKALPILSNGEDGRWRWGKKKFEVDKHLLFGRLVSGTRWDIFEKDYLKDDKTTKLKSVWIDKELNYENAKAELKDIFGGTAPFDYPKTTYLVKKILTTTFDNAIILDFMAGSGTTGHAVLEANKEDGVSRQFILCTNNENNICTDVCYPRLKKVIKGYKNAKDENIAGLGGNLKYYACDFVEAEPTDRNKRKLVSESTEMLCIRENTFELVQDEDDFKIFRNSKRYLGIVFYEEAINDFKKAIKKIKGHFNTYVFSVSDDPHEKQFADVKSKVTLCAIPEVILKVYREIFK